MSPDRRTTFDDETRDLEAERTEAERQIREAGGGEAEGFEQAEADAQDRAEDPAGHRAAGRAFPAESEESGAEYGEADGQNPDAEAAH